MKRLISLIAGLLFAVNVNAGLKELTETAIDYVKKNHNKINTVELGYGKYSKQYGVEVLDLGGKNYRLDYIQLCRGEFKNVNFSNKEECEEVGFGMIVYDREKELSKMYKNVYNNNEGYDYIFGHGDTYLEIDIEDLNKPFEPIPNKALTDEEKNEIYDSYKNNLEFILGYLLKN